MGLNAMILVFWMLSFKPAFSSSTFIKRCSIEKAECQRIDAFLNCGVGEDSWESLGQEYKTSQS